MKVLIIQMRAKERSVGGRITGSVQPDSDTEFSEKETLIDK